MFYNAALLIYMKYHRIFLLKDNHKSRQNRVGTTIFNNAKTISK